MTWAIVLVGIALVLLVLLIRLVHLVSHKLELPAADTVQQCEAALCVFRLLVDRREEYYLRRSLPEAEFRVLQRKRLWIAMRCLHLLERHATLLIRMGEMAAASDDPKMVREGQRLVAGTLQLKVNLLVAETTLLLKWLFPAAPLVLPTTGLKIQQQLHSFGKPLPRERDVVLQLSSGI